MSDRSAAAADEKYYVLTYDVIADFLARRTQFREDHLRLVREANRRGELLLAGALADPADRALLVFRTQDRAIVENFAREDPYVINGLVRHWDIRPWAVVVSPPHIAAQPGD